MTEKQPTYAAIITVQLPGLEAPAELTVVLAPPDQVPIAPGRSKALQDCSLADLEAFVQNLEAAEWDSYKAEKLSALTEADDTGVSIVVLDDHGEPIPVPPEALWQHTLLMPAQTVRAEAGEEPALTPEETSDPAVGSTPVAVSSPEIESAPEAEAPSAGETGAEVEHASTADEEQAANVEAAPVESGEAPTPPSGGIRIAGLRRPPGHPSPAATDILINEKAFRDAQAHALTSLSREVAGMLVGPPPEKQPDGRYLTHVTDVIIARHTRMHGASVTYTPESWRYVTDVLCERYPNEEAVIVGWYHTHPGFGIFLSGMDLFIHKNFFTQKWHVALVLDPVARRSGFFSWDRQQTAVTAHEFPWPHWAQGSW